MRYRIIIVMLLFWALATAFPQNLASPYSNNVFPAQIFTASGQTGTPIQLNGLVVSSTVGSSFASGIITVTGSSLTTVTFSLQGSGDNGKTYFPLPLGAINTPGNSSTSVTATTPGLYLVSLAGITHVRFAISGTFTATNVSLTLTASPNGLPTGLAGGGSGGGGGVGQPFQVQVKSNGTGLAATQFLTDPTLQDLLNVRNFTSSTVNNSFYANPAAVPSVANVQSVINSAGTGGEAVIPANYPAMQPGPTSGTPSFITHNGKTGLGPGTYYYTICALTNSATGVQQKCNPSVVGPFVITSGTDNVINFQFNKNTTSNFYALYGRSNLSQKFIRVMQIGGGNLFDDGSITPTTDLVNSITNLTGQYIDDLRYGVVARSATGVPVRMFCGFEAEDGITDARACIQAAIDFAIANNILRVQFTPGKHYKIYSAAGYAQLAGDDGTCQVGWTVAGAPCSTIPALYAMQAYSLRLYGSGLVLQLNGATLTGSYSGVATGQTGSLDTPAMFLCDSCSELEIDGGGQFSGVIQGTWIALLAPGGLTFANIHDVSIAGSVGFPLLARFWDSSRIVRLTYRSEAGLTIGHWYSSRGNLGSGGTSLEQGGYCDGCHIEDSRYQQEGTFNANHANTDIYFYTNIYQGQNQGNGRMVDVPGTSSPNGPGSLNTQIPYPGVFGQALMMFGRYGRANNGPYITNFQSKQMARSLIYNSAAVSFGFVNTLGAEFGATCDGVLGASDFIGVACLDPYNPAGMALNAGLINGFVWQGTVFVSIGCAQGYQAPIQKSAITNSTIMGSSICAGQAAPTSQITIPGNSGNPGTLLFASQSGSNADNWNVTQNPNTTGGFGGTIDWVHNLGGGAASTFGFSVRFPYISLFNMPATTCEDATTGNVGHRGTFGRIDGGTGVADQFIYCGKDAAGNFVRRDLLGYYAPGGGVTTTLGTGVTSATCVTASCTQKRGSYLIVGGTATTGNILTLAWSTTTTPYVCTVTQNGLSSFLGIGNTVATATGMTIRADNTIAGQTFTVNYSCQP